MGLHGPLKDFRQIRHLQLSRFEYETEKYNKTRGNGDSPRITRITRMGALSLYSRRVKMFRAHPRNSRNPRRIPCSLVRTPERFFDLDIVFLERHTHGAIRIHKGFRIVYQRLKFVCLSLSDIPLFLEYESDGGRAQIELLLFGLAPTFRHFSRCLRWLECFLIDLAFVTGTS